MYKLFIVEDDTGIAEAIKVQAEMWDLQVHCTENFHNVMTEFSEFSPHIYQPLHQIKHVLASKHWKLKVSSDESSS